MLLQCQLQLFEENRCFAWELFWVASLWSGSTVTYLNWAASCVDCEMNWSVASQLNRAHSSQRGDHLARPSQSNREPIPSIPTLRNVRQGSLGSKLCHTSAYRLNKSHHTSPIFPIKPSVAAFFVENNCHAFPSRRSSFQGKQCSGNLRALKCPLPDLEIR